ncbi:STAS domain-containing protein [Actinoplanes sp. URMC 104]|uniref:STAS domain-containing protein n=1 Tax=Actinoplanes sp. URMC 104 TaxID=3423409 RepID=UPI003F1D4228
MTLSPSGYADSHLKVHVLERVGADAVVTMAGELDTFNSTQVRDVVTGLLSPEPPGRIVLDMGEVTFLDSSGVRSLLICQEAAAARGVRIILERPNETVRQILTICGVDQLFA